MAEPTTAELLMRRYNEVDEGVEQGLSNLRALQDACRADNTLENRTAVQEFKAGLTPLIEEKTVLARSVALVRGGKNHSPQ